MRYPKLQIFLDNLKWAHALASWIGAIAIAIGSIYSSTFHSLSDWILLVCLAFLAPLIAPFVLSVMPKMLVLVLWGAGFYVVTFCIAWPLVARSVRKKLARTSQFMIDPEPDVLHGLPLTAQWIAIATMIVDVCVCMGFGDSRNGMRTWVALLLAAPALLALPAGFAGCIRSKPATRNRSAAFASLCVGVVFTIFWAYFFCCTIKGWHDDH